MQVPRIRTWPGAVVHWLLSTTTPALILAVVVVIGLGIGLGWLFDATPGTTAEWLTAVATIGALCAAVVAGRYAADAHALEVKREEDRLQAEMQAQASLVSAWPTEVKYRQDSDPHGNPYKPTGIEGAAVRFRNASAAPVSDLVVNIFAGIITSSGRRIEHYLGEHSVNLLPPTADQPAGTINQTLDGPHFLFEHRSVAWDDVHEVKIELAITFTDARGYRWSRSHKGRLTRHSEPDR